MNRLDIVAQRLSREDYNQNWAKSLKYSSKRVYQPSTIEQVVEIIKNNKKITALGTRHSFNTIADNNDVQILTRNFNRISQIDKQQRSIVVGSGVRYAQLAKYLHSQGYALHNLASLPHISVGGAICTATHGSGFKIPSLSSSVIGIQFVNGKGQLTRISINENKTEFYGSVVNLGALGFMISIKLYLVPTFQLSQWVFQDLPIEKLYEKFHEIMRSGYSVSLFTHWFPNKIDQVWVIRQEGTLNKVSDFYGAIPASQTLHPTGGDDQNKCTQQHGKKGPWHERLPHFKPQFTPSSGQQLQTQYYFAEAQVAEAISQIMKIGDQIREHLLITEIRSVGQDQFWMSPCYQQRKYTIHFTWKQHIQEVKSCIDLIEKTIRHLNPISHWSKLSNLTPKQIHNKYPKIKDFIKLCQKHDPEGKFRNNFLQQKIFSFQMSQ